MRKLASSGLFLIAALGTAYAAEPLGEWRVEEGVATIKIVDCDSRLWGVVASEKTPGGTDRHNPDKSKRSRPTLGIPILLNMKKDPAEKAQWEGQIYNAQNGKTYDATIRLKSPNVLKVEGCMMSILCGGQTWTRVIEPAQNSAGDATAQPTTGSARAQQPAPGAKPPTSLTPAPAPTPRTTAKTTTKAGHKAAPALASPTDDDDDAAQSEVCLLPEIAGAPH